MASSIGPVIDAIVALCKATNPLPTQVVDGFPLADQGGMLIGVGGTVEPPAEGEQVPNQIGGFQLREEYDVQVLINASSGDTDQRALREQVIAAYNAIVDGWRAQQLGQTGLAVVCEMSWPANVSIRQTNYDSLADGRPWFAELTFTMHIVAHNS